MQRSANIINPENPKPEEVSGSNQDKFNPCLRSLELEASTPVNQENLPYFEKYQQIQQQENENDAQDVIEEEEDSQRMKWNQEQDELLLNLHNELGNKWTDIANKFEDKDHNNVKNHFYAQIRKSVRRMNSCIKWHHSLQFKKFNMSHLSKMITMLSEKSAPSPDLIALIRQKNQQFLSLKKRVFYFARSSAGTDLSQEEITNLSNLLEQIYFFLSEIKKHNLMNKKKKNKAKMTQSLTQYHTTYARSQHIKIEQQKVKVEAVQRTIVKQQPLAIKYEENINQYIVSPRQPQNQYQFSVPSFYNFAYIPNNYIIFYNSLQNSGFYQGSHPSNP